MALQQKHTVFIFGKQLDFDEAYVQITRVNGNKNLVTIDVTIYDSMDKEYVVARNSYQFTPAVDDGAVRWDKQGYEHLKTLPEFNIAIDC